MHNSILYYGKAIRGINPQHNGEKAWRGPSCFRRHYSDALTCHSVIIRDAYHDESQA